MEEIALVENIQRENLTPVEEARALQRLMARHALSMRALSEQLGKHHSYVQDRLKLLSDPRIVEAVDAGVVGPTVAVEIANLPDEETRTELLNRAARGEQIRLKDVQAARQTTPMLADNPPPTPVPDRRDRTDLADYPPASSLVDTVRPVISSRPAEDNTRPAPPRDTRSGGEEAADRAVADYPPLSVAGNWVHGADLQTVLLIQAGDGRADRDQVRAALWADLEALDG